MTLRCEVFLNVNFSVLYFSSCVITCKFLELQNYLLNGKHHILLLAVQFKWDQKNYLSLSIIHIFSEIRVHRKGRDLATALSGCFMLAKSYRFICKQTERKIRVVWIRIFVFS